MIDATGPIDRPLPDYLLLANRAGFRWLSKFFAAMADRSTFANRRPWGEDDLAAIHDPDDHVHLQTRGAPFVANLSGESEFRLGTLTRANRERVFEKYALNKDDHRGDLIERYERLIESVRPHLDAIGQARLTWRSKRR